MPNLKYTLARPVFLYPAFDAFGTAQGTPCKAPAGMPVEVLKRASSGKGRKRVERCFIATAAPAGWGQFTHKRYFGWIDASCHLATNEEESR